MGSRPACIFWRLFYWVQVCLSQNQLVRAPTGNGLNKLRDWNNFLGTHLEKESNEKSDQILWNTCYVCLGCEVILVVQFNLASIFELLHYCQAFFLGVLLPSLKLKVLAQARVMKDYGPGNKTQSVYWT